MEILLFYTCSIYGELGEYMPSYGKPKKEEKEKDRKESRDNKDRRDRDRYGDRHRERGSHGDRGTAEKKRSYFEKPVDEVCALLC